MRPVSLAAAVVAGLGSTSALAAPPTTPGDLSVDVYSGTAAELFWSRSTDPDGFVRGYEIRRDGELLDTRDGLSYFTDSLTEGRASAFTVTAVDFDGERSTPASVSVVGGDREGAIGSGGGRPTPPANLRSEVYSSSAAEVFWDRSDQPGLSYEVSRNGEVVATTDGTSAFLSGLPRTAGETIDVVAIDANGRRSGAATVTLGGGAEPGPGPGTDGPPAPANARIEVYSRTAAELFWDRAPADANVAETEIVRDGEAIGSTDGTSFFDGDRAPGRDYLYELIATDGSGNASSTTVVGESNVATTPPGDTTGLLSPANVDALLAGFADLVDDNAAARLAPRFRRLADIEGDAPGRSVGDTERVLFDDFSVVFRTVVTCDGGGSYVHERPPGPGNLRFTMRFDGCVFEGVAHDGTAAVRLDSSDTNFEVRFDDVDARPVSGPAVEGLDGFYDRRFVSAGIPIENEIVSNVDYRQVDGDEITEVIDLDVGLSSSTGRTPRITLNLDGSEINAPWTNGETISLRVANPDPSSTRLGRDGFTEEFFTSGRLIFEREVGTDVLIVDTETGDPSTYSVTATTVDGSTVSALGRWTEATNPECLTFAREDLAEVVPLCTR